MTLIDLAALFQHRNWNGCPADRIADGIERQIVSGERVMVCRLSFAPGVVTTVHSHSHEQITLVERGRVRFQVAGADHLAAAGDVLFFPSGIEHGATILDEPAVLRREQLRPSVVATRAREVTQPQARTLHERHPEAAGLRWWSTFESQWLNVTLFDRAAAALRLVSARTLTIEDEEVAAAADVLGLRPA